MIRFDPAVRLRYVHWALLPIFVNASMWANRHERELCIADIDDGASLQSDLRYQLLHVHIQVDKVLTGDTARLAAYLTKHLPADFAVSSTDHIVYVHWTADKIRPGNSHDRRQK